MACTTKRIEEMNNRRALALTILKNATESDPISKRKFASLLGCAGVTFDRDIAAIRKEFPKHVGHIHHKGYFWCEKEDKKEMTTLKAAKESKTSANKYDYTKTEEGYSDPTAAKAMDTMPDTYLPGDIWDYANSNGTIERVVVIAANGYRATCVRLYGSEKEANSNELYELSPVTDRGELVGFINPTYISTKPTKYFLKDGKVNELSMNAFEAITATVNNYLGLSNVRTVEIEKPIEVKIEVPSDILSNGKTVEDFEKLEAELEALKDKHSKLQAVNSGFSGTANNGLKIDSTGIYSISSVEEALLEQKAKLYEEFNNKLYDILKGRWAS